jgi:hypothetical protein
MSKVIIYPKDDGGLAIVIPAKNSEMSIEQIAEKDVPKGKPYEIIDYSSLPKDREFRDSWEFEQTPGPKGM